ncbi:MAG TPA: hypothetical protein PKA64_19835, partial [Myxococcota bacterium]|nr:hypothetical protein [Myxococcota bacterium]
AWGDVALAAGVGGLTAPLPSGPGPLRLRSDAPTHLVSVSLGAPTRMAWWVGDDVDARPPTLRLAGGRTSDHHTVPTFAAPPPELPPAQARGARLLAPKLTALADAPSDPEALGRLEEGAQAGNDYLADACSPVRVLEDGAPLAWPDTFCAHVAQLGHGRTCHVGDAVQFSSSDGTDPQRNGRRYTLALDPSRACKLKVRRGETAIHDGWWLYPGDAASFLAPPERRALLAAPATQVAVRAIAVTGDDDLVIEAGGAVLTVPAADLRDDATVTLTLTGPVSADAPVVVRAPGHTYWLLTYLALSSS